MDSKYQDALDFIENEEVFYEVPYKEDDVIFGKAILNDVDYLKEHFDVLQELIDNYIESEENHKIALKEMAESIEMYQKVLDRACAIIEEESKGFIKKEIALDRLLLDLPLFDKCG